jgi:hypothetical protein
VSELAQQQRLLRSAAPFRHDDGPCVVILLPLEGRPAIGSIVAEGEANRLRDWITSNESRAKVIDAACAAIADWDLRQERPT